MTYTVPAGTDSERTGEISMTDPKCASVRQWLLCLIVLAVTVLLFLPQGRQYFQALATNGISYEPGTVKTVLSEELSDSDLKGGQQLGVQELEILMDSGETIRLTNYLTATHNILAQTGSRVIVCVDAPENVEPYYTLYNYDRTGGVVAILTVFLLLMAAVGGRKGLASALAVVFSLAFFLRVTVPAIYEGASPLLMGMTSVLAAAVVTILLLYGPTFRGAIAVGVTLAGESTACLLFWGFSRLLHLTGFQTSDAESLLVVAQNTGLNLSTVLFAATMIASLGAVMDVAMSLLSALWELCDVGERTPRELFRAGLNIGRDMIGINCNTLIFAFAGSSLMTILVLYSYGTQANQLLSSDYLAQELAQGLCGTCGVILTVPLAVAAAAWLFPKIKDPGTASLHKIKPARR